MCICEYCGCPDTVLETLHYPAFGGGSSSRRRCANDDCPDACEPCSACGEGSLKFHSEDECQCDDCGAIFTKEELS